MGIAIALMAQIVDVGYLLFTEYFIMTDAGSVSLHKIKLVEGHTPDWQNPKLTQP